MATGREHLQSIMSALGDLQNMTDEQLDSVADGLKRVDDDLREGIDYLKE